MDSEEADSKCDPKIYSLVALSTDNHTEVADGTKETRIAINDDGPVETDICHTTQTLGPKRGSKWTKLYLPRIVTALKVIIAALFLAYVGYSMTVEFGSENSWRLLMGTVFGYLLMGWNLIKKTQCYHNVKEDLKLVSCNGKTLKRIRKYIRWGLYVGMLVMIGSLVGTAVAKGNIRNLLSFGGLLVMIFSLFITSRDRKQICWHSVFWGFGIQFILAILLLRINGGKLVVMWMSTRLDELLQHSKKGSQFLFGPKYSEFYFAFELLPKVIFFISMVRVLNHLGVLRFVNRTIGSFLSFITETSTPESICAVANIFVGGGQSILFIKEYMNYLTEPEIFCVFVGDLASIGGGAVVLFSGYGIPTGYLITASALSAPAALAAAKLNYPSNPSVKKDGGKKDEEVRTESNALHALSQGARTGLKFIGSISANILVLMAVLDLVDTSLEWFGARAGLENFNFEKVSSYLFWPFAFLLGVDFQDCFRVGNLLGLRSLLDLTVAYLKMGQYFENKSAYNKYVSLYNDTVFDTGSYDIFLPQWNKTLEQGILSSRSEVITAFALCGFASLSSLGIIIGSISVLAPMFLEAVTRLCPRAMLVGTAACYFTACVAGMIYQEN